MRRLRHASIPIQRVVDVGCGAGPLTEALVEAGFETTGIDSSAELLAIAQAAAPTAHFINASIYDVEIPRCEAKQIGLDVKYAPKRLDDAVMTLYRHYAARPMLPQTPMVPGLAYKAHIAWLDSSAVTMRWPPQSPTS